MSVTEKELEQLKQVTIKLFQQAFKVHKNLGDRGKLPQNINAFGEKTLVADWEAEEVFIKGCSKAEIPIVFSSEEHGEISLVDKPRFRGVVDGIDGTNAYKMGSGPYGTMFAIFEGVNPRYQDYLVVGILEYPSGRILMATQGGGALIQDGKRSYPVQSSGLTSLDPNQTRVFIDGGIDFSREFFLPKFRNFGNIHVGNIALRGIPWGASSIYYFKLATGETDVVLETTRKRNLEYAVSYGILNEVGAVIIDRNGESIGERKYLEFGQGKNEYIPIISACTEPLAQAIANIL